MLAWIQANIASIIVASVLTIIVVLIIRGMIKDKKAGRHTCGCSCDSCGGSCAGCHMNGQCHKE